MINPAFALARTPASHDAVSPADSRLRLANYRESRSTPNPLRNEARRKETFRDLIKTVFLGILSERGRAEPPLDFIQASAPILARYRGCLLSSASTTDSSLTYHLDKDVPPLS